MEIIIGIVGAICVILLSLLGIEKRKNSKKDEVIRKQEQQIAQQHKQNEVYKENQELTSQFDKEVELIEEQQVGIEQEIVEADSSEELIKIANGIVTRFNAE
jgi:cell division protein FtsB